MPSGAVAIPALRAKLIPRQRFMDDADLVALGLHAKGNLCGVVLGRVVDDDNAERPLERLAVERVQLTAERPGRVQSRYDHGH